MPLASDRPTRRLRTEALGALLVAGSSLVAAPQTPAESPTWALAPVRSVAPPAVDDAGWSRNDIDRFVFARLRTAGLSPSPAADRLTLVRRMYLVLHGLPPTPTEVAEFVADGAPDAYERLVDRVLASPRYGERQATHWLDIVHFAETSGFETNTARPRAWPYRDWVIDAFNADLPYPAFIRAQLAGDADGDDAATGFLVAGPYDEVKSPDPVLTATQRHEEIRDIVNTATTAFLGLTVACATCHDHKFDPIPQRDFYALKAIFAGVAHGERELRGADAAAREAQRERVRGRLVAVRAAMDEHEPLASPGTEGGMGRRSSLDAQRNVDRFAPVAARIVRFTVLATNGAEPCLDELEVYAAGNAARNVALASAGGVATASSVYPDNPRHRLEHIHDGWCGNDHSWISREVGGGWVQIELKEPVVVDRVVWGRDREARYADRLATAYRIEVGDAQDALRVVADASDRRPIGEAAPEGGADVPPALASLRTELAALQARLVELAPQRAYAGTFAEPRPTRLLARGDPMVERAEVAPGALTAVALPLDLPRRSNEQARRLAFARWLGDSANPLPARVMVNRIWQHVFGEGLVSTPSDFGAMGARPSHPDLLDHMATRFMADGWSTKRLLRALLLSSTFRQDSCPRPAALRVDAGNRLLWRFAPRRLEAEVIHDAILLTSGALDLRMGGPGTSAFVPNDSYVRVYEPKTEFGPADWRRMVYQTKVRMVQEPVFGAFDCPDAGQVASRRQRSTTPLQALSLFNSGFVVQQADLFAGRLQTEAPGGVPEAVERAFVLALGRPPTTAESAASMQLAEVHGLAQVCRALFNANEFVFVQ